MAGLLETQPPLGVAPIGEGGDLGLARHEGSGVEQRHHHHVVLKASDPLPVEVSKMRGLEGIGVIGKVVRVAIRHGSSIGWCHTIEWRLGARM